MIAGKYMKLEEKKNLQRQRRPFEHGLNYWWIGNMIQKFQFIVYKNAQ